MVDDTQMMVSNEYVCITDMSLYVNGLKEKEKQTDFVIHLKNIFQTGNERHFEVT